MNPEIFFFPIWRENQLGMGPISISSADWWRGLRKYDSHPGLYEWPLACYWHMKTQMARWRSIIHRLLFLATPTRPDPAQLPNSDEATHSRCQGWRHQQPFSLFLLGEVSPPPHFPLIMSFYKLNSKGRKVRQPQWKIPRNRMHAFIYNIF